MRITLVQSHIIWENREANLERAERVICQCQGSDLILFPEMSFTGFSMNTALTADRDGRTSEYMKKLAVANRVSIGFGWVRAGVGDSEKCENVYTIVSPEGEKTAEFVKIHPFSYSREDESFRGGEQIAGFDIGGIPMSVFICYDLRFPELFRSACERAHVIIVPACWPAKRAEHWKTLLRARAIENQLYIIGVNCKGDIGGQYYSGDSCVIDPDGEPVTPLSELADIHVEKTGGSQTEDEQISYELCDDVREYRAAFPVLPDRKPWLYDRFRREKRPVSD